MTILVVAAHPDDEVLAMGGTIAHACNKGGPGAVHILFMTPGRDGGKATKEMYKAAKALGAVVWGEGKFPDNRLDTIPLLDIVRRVERAIEAVKPDTVYTHRRHDLNIDHELTARAVLTATRPGTSPVREVYAFDSPSSSEWDFGGSGFAPTVFQELDASDLTLACKALNCYKSELRQDPHPRSEGQFLVRRQYWGSVAGYDYAEPFELVRWLRA